MSWVNGLWQRLAGDSGTEGGQVPAAGPAAGVKARAQQPDRPLVYLRAPRYSDEREFIEIMRESQEFHRQWATAPTDVVRFGAYLEDAQRPDFEAFLVLRSEDDRIVGFFNLSQITRGSLQGAYLGYAAAARYAGRGYMREGIDLVLREAFLELRLHRIEANIQPGNNASLALARGAGFKREGFSPRYLKINGQWRDHERWAILAEDWRRMHGLDAPE